jgi:hypothetical protein
MRLVELFLRETTEEDRAILSLSSAISKYIQQFETIDDNGGDDWRNKDYDELENDDYDVDEIEDDKPIKLGKIGELFNTPLEGLNHINLELQSDYGIRLRMKKEGGREIKRPEDEMIYGLWYGNSDTVVLNKDFIGSNALKTVVSHELRHALDDVKSDYKANKPGGRYSIPKKKEHRKNDPYQPNLSYIAEPAEINARFVEVLHLLVPVIQRAAKLPNVNVRDQAMSEFKRFLKAKSIEKLFPEGTASRDYKRLLKRGVDFIDKEIAHVTGKK